MANSTLKYYNENGDSLSERYETADVSDLHELLLKSFKNSPKLLELGCGSARDAAFMTGKGFQVTGIDGSQPMIERALINHPELSGQLHTILLPDGLSETLGTYDGVFSIAVLMHLSRPDIDVTIKKIKMLLVSKGKFFFSVPVCRDDVKKNEFDGKGRRFTALTKDGWTDLCNRHGFRIIQASTTEDGLGRPGIKWLNCLTEKTE